MLHLIDGHAPALPAGHRRAIVSVVIGDEYRRIWDAVSRGSWERYAATCGYDLVIVTQPLDRSDRGLGRSPAWQKLLVLDQPWAGQYERIVFLDADIIISDGAPDVVESAPDPAKVGVCVSGGQLSEAGWHIYLERLYKFRIHPSRVEAARLMHEGGRLSADGITDPAVPMLNTGVMVLSPQHNDLLLATYAKDGASRLYEQPHLSQDLFRAGLIHPISPRFNWGVHEMLTLDLPPDFALSDATLPHLVTQIRNELEKSYFLHFAGSMPLLRVLAGMPDALRPAA